MDEFEDAVRHLNYCVMPNPRELPDRSVINPPPPVDMTRPYLRYDGSGTTAQYRVIFRGLDTGIYTSW